MGLLRALVFAAGFAVFGWGVLDRQPYAAATGLLVTCGALIAHALRGRSDLDGAIRRPLAAVPAAVALAALCTAVVLRERVRTGPTADSPALNVLGGMPVGGGYEFPLDEPVVPAGIPLIMLLIAAAALVAGLVGVPAHRRRGLGLLLGGVAAAVPATALLNRLLPPVGELPAVLGGPGVTRLILVLFPVAVTVAVLVRAVRHGASFTVDAAVLATGLGLIAAPFLAQLWPEPERGGRVTAFVMATTNSAGRWEGPSLALAPVSTDPWALVVLLGLALLVAGAVGVRAPRPALTASPEPDDPANPEAR